MALKIQEKNNKQNHEVYNFKTFSGPSFPITGSFRENILDFIQENGQVCCTQEEEEEEGVRVWITHLDNNGIKIPLYTIEESIEHSYIPYCSICSDTGWNHLISKRRYRLIIPNTDKWDKQLLVSVSSLPDLDNDTTYLLHGVIHCNGFGHLLKISGNQEKGSKNLFRYEVMDLWDRLCTNLGTRSISVKDVSNLENAKYTSRLALLYLVAYGQSRFAKWNYKLYSGADGLNLQRFEAAITSLASINLDEVVQNMAIKVDSDDSRRIIVLIGKYRLLSENNNLITLRDLLKLMVSKHQSDLNRQKDLEAQNSSLDRLLSTCENVQSVRGDITNLFEHIWCSYLKKPDFAVLRNNCFVKAWEIKDEGDKVLKFMCPIRLSLFPFPIYSCNNEHFDMSPRSLELGELVVLPLHATIGDLKLAAENCYRDTYFMMKTFEVTGVEGGNHLADDVLAREYYMESGGQLWLEGTEELQSEYTHTLLYQGFQLVNCSCGARASDGKKMRKCDMNMCPYLIHPKCTSDKYNDVFICKNCES